MTRLTRRSLILAAAAAPVLIAGTAQAATHQVVIEGMSFAPATLRIARGDSVTFTNRDRAPHTATQRPQGFDTGRLNTGGTASASFASAGTYEYVCAFHPMMRGTIIVS